MVYGDLALFQKWRARRARFDTRFRPPVSVIIAAYNEEKVIARTVEFILRNGYEDLDWSSWSTKVLKDATLEVLRRSFRADPKFVL